MRRKNLRFNKRLRVRDSVEERLVYAEKLNDLMMRQYVIQTNINKEFQGKYDGMVKKLRTMQTKRINCSHSREWSYT